MEAIGDFEYSKKDLIGHGAFAVVFKGRNRKKHDAVVAIKAITKKNLAKSQNLLSKEIKILKELSGLQHENVVALLDCKETSHHVYLVMEYCNGGDLADYLQVKGTLSEDTISQFFKQIAGAMKALNAKGIVHRDLKPQNILLCHASQLHTSSFSASDTRLKIADFGFARFLQDGVMAATLCGSPMYMAPEVIMSLQYDAKADLWSVGTIMYQCLTGKAPFQAQTPQQLKQFYEKNLNLQPNIPSGTSRELRHLLMHLLKRNAKDRMEFDDFFKHPFLNPRPHTKSSSPVPVPRRSSRSSLKAISVSPLSGHMGPSSASSTPKSRDVGIACQEPMDTGSPQETAGGFLKVHQDGAAQAGIQKTDSNVEDYVMVPDASDQLACSNNVTGTTRRISSSTDLTVFNKQQQQLGPRTASKTHVDAVRVESPSRPSSLPVMSAPSTSPIPVPSQVKAYQQIQRSIGHSPSSSSPGWPQSTPSPASPSPRFQTQHSPHSAAVTIVPKHSTGSVPSLGSISPPTVQFSIGTPPSSGGNWRRNSMGTPPSGGKTIIATTSSPRSISNSPLKRTSSATSPLPTILGSPIKVSSAFAFPGGSNESPTSPLHTPFATLRTKTCPDHIGEVGYHQDAKSVVPVSRFEQRPSELESVAKMNSGVGKFSDQLFRAAFATTSPPSYTNTGNTGLPVQLSRSPPGTGLLPYTAADSPGSSNRTPGNMPSKEPYSEPFSTSQQRITDMEGSPSHLSAQSPGNMEGPITFVAPELVEETLMDKAHRETAGKLNFVVALVECIIELAQCRSSPLSESMTDNTFCLDHVPFSTQPQRHMEQLLLYVRALQLLSSSIQLAKEEVAKGRLHVHSSSTVKLILKDMNSYYHQCLSVCKQLHNKGIPENETELNTATITADKLIYSHAIELCQTAALDELFGNPQECFRRYRSAQILLHSLAQQAQSDNDRQLLRKYKESVEKRLFNLHNQGVVQMNVCDSA